MNTDVTSKKAKVVVVMPAYNAARTLERTVRDIPAGVVHEIILVDDASQDETATIASELAKEGLLNVYMLPRNRGYGGNQKECYRRALAAEADVIVMVHPDYQYDPQVIPELIAPLLDGSAHVMLGTRMHSKDSALGGGMPFYKYFANRTLSAFQSAVTGQSLTDWHTGMRAYTKEALLDASYEGFSEGFLFDTQMLLSIVGRGLSMREVPIPTRYLAESSSISLFESIKYGLSTVLETLHFHSRYNPRMKTPSRSRAAFTLIELLVVIAIIGTLSSIIINALNGARIKAANTSIKANMHTVVAQAALDYDGNGESYGTQTWTANATSFTPGVGVAGASALFADKVVGNAINEVISRSGSVSYASNGVSWILISPLLGGNYWCVSSEGEPKSYYSAPTVTYNYGGSAATKFKCL